MSQAVPDEAEPSATALLDALFSQAPPGLFVLDTELRPGNSHVAQEVLDSLENLENPDAEAAEPSESRAQAQE